MENKSGNDRGGEANYQSYTERTWRAKNADTHKT
jgi:hypothetical protein